MRVVTAEAIRSLAKVPPPVQAICIMMPRPKLWVQPSRIRVPSCLSREAIERG
jgi:hypothetical protein